MFSAFDLDGNNQIEYQEIRLSFMIIEAEKNIMTKKMENDLFKKYCFYSETKKSSKKKQKNVKTMLFNQFLMMCVDQAIFKKKKILGKFKRKTWNLLCRVYEDQGE